MKVLYDTSVLIPALLTVHSNHALAFFMLEMAREDNIQGYLSAHSLAEFYSVTTRLPPLLRISPVEAQATISRFLKYLLPVELSAEDYRWAIAQVTSLQLAGGVMYDAVIAQAALKAGVDQLITLNPKDFLRLGSEVSGLVVVPE